MKEIPMTDKLTREQLEQLRRPFPANKISFKCQTKPNEKGNSLVVAYIDARDVMERLDEVMGPDWSDRYEKVEGGKGLMCYLTVGGVTRADVGDEDSQNEAAKSAVSDAFKRAAVKFGVGRFLYDLPKMWGKAKVLGNSTFLEDAEGERLRRQVDDFLAGRKPATQSSGPGNSFPVGSAAKPAAKPTSAAGSVRAVETGAQSNAKKAKSDDLRRRHGELWLQCSKAGLVKAKDAVQAWSITPSTGDDEIVIKIAGMESALKRARG
jgi:hypothetical protein